MTRTSEGLAAFVVDQLEELYRRMWVLRLLDMALEQLRIEGLINGPLQGGFGQEAVSVGAAAALGEGDVIITTHRPHAQHVGTDAPLGPVIADMLGATAGDLEGADEDAHIADPRAGLPAAIRVVKQSPLLAIGHAYALWLRDTGRVTLCVTQDCDVDADAFNEAADLAAVWQLPVVILVENIRGALSVHLDRYTHEPRVYRRAVAYGMPGVSTPGTPAAAIRTSPWSSDVLLRLLALQTGQDLDAGIGNQQGVFELCGPLAVLGDHRPTVVPDFVVQCAQVDHRLDGEGHPRLHDGLDSGLVVVQDDQPVVERRADAMTSEVSNHVVPEPICIRLDDTTDNGQRPPGLDGVDRTHGRFAGPVNEQPVFVCDIAGRKRRVGVTVHPTDVGGDVDVDDVAVGDHRRVGDSMADDLVEGRAARLRESLVAQR